MQKNTLKNFLIDDLADDHPLFDYNYTEEEHSENKYLYTDIFYEYFVDIEYENIDFEYYYKNLKMYHILAEQLLDDNIKDIENLLIEMIYLSYQMLYNITDKCYMTIMDDLLDVYNRKNWDYNNAAENQLRYSGAYSFKTTLEHKMLRLQSFYNDDDIKVGSEKVNDTIMDLVNYCMIYLMWSKKGYPTERNIKMIIEG